MYYLNWDKEGQVTGSVDLWCHWQLAYAPLPQFPHLGSRANILLCNHKSHGPSSSRHFELCG